MGFKLVPKLSVRRRRWMSSATYFPRLAKFFAQLPESCVTPEDQLKYLVGIRGLVGPIDPAGRMDQASLAAFQRAFLGASECSQ
jgi:hypothetical protein